ncbi:amino acid adenylation domain-containing protein [Kitasatospora sp. NPDC089913]|uniref:amino acid adenylation domain-containing protein n=1 Tax=Kitasatospora sp. NPDC089913 TaxID=3364080 RepID=UPI0037F58B96
MASAGTFGTGLVHRAFEETAVRVPDEIAVLVGTVGITYAELDRRAGAVARELRRLGVGRGASVGVCLERDTWLVPALLGIWKAGAAYVPLDPAYPADRTAFVVADSGMSHLVSSAAVLRRCGEALRATGVDLLEVGTVVTGADDPAGPGAADDGEPTDAAYVMYTSGSTGRPKGVVVEHRNVAALLEWESSVYSAAELRGMLAATSVCFDPSVTQLFLPLLRGGTVILAENLLALSALPARDRVTTVYGTPSALAALVREPLPPGVRTVRAGGEPLTRALADRIHANPGVGRVVQSYGPTECTVSCLTYEVPAVGREEPPIGSAYAGSGLSVRDGAGNPLDDGGTGELWVSGPLVGRGYLGRPGLTAERFVTDAAGVRHYRTGDLVRRIDGLHHFAGRIDDQVKVRGFRIELGEVEAVLAGHPAVQHAVALAPADEDGTRILLACAESADRTLTGVRLRSWLRDRLPEHLVPSRIAVLDRLPVGPTGKTDRAALAAVEFGRAVDTEYAAPRTGTERRIAGTVADVLGLAPTEVGVHDDFGALGGHSLAAARLCAVLGRDFGTAVSLTEFLAAPTVAGLAALLRTGPADRPGSAPGPALVRHTGRDSYPLTAAQQGMWLLRQIGSGEGATTIAFRLRLRGLPGTARLRAALDGVVERHEVLRSVVLADGGLVGGPTAGTVPTGAVSAGAVSAGAAGDATGRAVDGEPVASVRAPSPVPFEEHDLRGLPGPERGKQAAELTRAAASHVFDLAAETPLLRATLLRLDEVDAELVVVTDHVAFDGWSIGVLMSELAAGLAGRAGGSDLAPPSVQVGDLALYERASVAGPDRVEELRAFWARELADAVPPHDLLPDPSAAPGGPGGERLARPLDAGTAAALRELAADCGSTPFATFLTALGVLVAGLTGRSDVVLGAAVAHRAHPELEAVVGPLVGISPIRLGLAEGESFRSAVGRAAATTARVMDHPGFTVQQAFEAAGVEHPRGTMGTPVVLSFQPAGLPVAVEHDGVRLELLGEATGGGTQAPLTVFVNETVLGLELRIAYDAERFGQADAEAFADRLLRILCAAAADPDLPLAALELVSAAERAELLAAGTGAPLPADRPATVVAAVLEQAARRPAAVAVSDAAGELGYAELAERSRRVAEALLAGSAATATASTTAAASATAATATETTATAFEPGAEPAGSFTVGVCLPRDRYLPAALLGVLRAGAAYLPLEPDQPVERLRAQLADSGATVVVAAGDTLALAGELAEAVGAGLLDLGVPGSPGPVWVHFAKCAAHFAKCSGTLQSPPAGPVALPEARPGALPEPPPEGLAYVLYTSGSTGLPKGVEVTHANLAAFVAAMRITPGVRSDDVMLGLTSPAFDVFGFELWVALACGLRLAVLDREAAVDGYAVARFVERSGVTLMTATPTTLRMLVAAGWSAPGVRVVSIGEPMDPDLADELISRTGELWNAYGPTESTVYSTAARVVTPVGEAVPIGRPLPGETAYVLDAMGRLVPPGVTGELWIGGAGVARGYRNRPDATAAAFVTDRFVAGRFVAEPSATDPVAPAGRRYRTGDLARWRPRGSAGERTLDFRGRRDQQVKLRGHRIELGEIETALRTEPAVADAAVVLRGGGADAHLVGYLAVGPAASAVSTSEVEERLHTRLPDHMVPRRWVVLDALPLTASGKVNRGALPAPARGSGHDSAGDSADDSARDRIAPRTDAELLAAEVWETVLGVAGVGAHDDFFALGGHSLAATRVAGRLMAALDLAVPVRLLFEHPVLADFAAGLEALLLADLVAAPGPADSRGPAGSPDLAAPVTPVTPASRPAGGAA